MVKAAFRPTLQIEGKVVELYKCLFPYKKCMFCNIKLSFGLYYYGIYCKSIGFKLICDVCKYKLQILEAFKN